jgi:hypothetical protein
MFHEFLTMPEPVQLGDVDAAARALYLNAKARSEPPTCVENCGTIWPTRLAEEVTADRASQTAPRGHSH